MLATELRLNQQHPATWEKKGNELITSKNIRKYRHIREGLFRLLTEIRKCNGKIFYHGREKYQAPHESHSSGLYTTIMGHSIRRIDEFCCTRSAKFMMIMDQHSDRKKLLENATKTMFGANPARCLLEPPFQVESNLYQTIQAADWIAALAGRILAHQIEPSQYSDWEWSEKYFGREFRSLATHSNLWRPDSAQRKLKFGASS